MTLAERIVRILETHTVCSQSIDCACFEIGEQPEIIEVMQLRDARRKAREHSKLAARAELAQQDV